MSVVSGDPVETLQRIPMSWEEYVALPEGTRAEWVDGVAIVSSYATGDHAFVQGKLITLLSIAFPSLAVLAPAALKRESNRVRIPDVVVLTQPPGKTGWMLEETPVIVVEVLSPSTRSEDTIRKSAEYLARGIAQYWIVDPMLRTLEVLASSGPEWSTALLLDEQQPTGAVLVGEHGTMSLDLAAILG